MSQKAVLLSAIAGVNRGLLATEADRERIAGAIAQLEALNSTPNPVSAPELLGGDWRLLYTTSRELLGIDRIPLVQLGSVYQCIRPDSTRVYNIAELIGLPRLEGLICVAARYEAVSEQRVAVKFERAILGLQRLLGYQSPSEMIRRIEVGKRFLPLDFSLEQRDRQGWLDITYLDSNLRINRGNEGSIFVLTKA